MEPAEQIDGYLSDGPESSHRSPTLSPRLTRDHSPSARPAIDGETVSATHSNEVSPIQGSGTDPLAVALRWDLRCPQCISSGLSHCYVSKTIPGKKAPSCLMCRRMAKRCDLSDECRARVDNPKTPTAPVPSLVPQIQDSLPTRSKDTTILSRPTAAVSDINRRRLAAAKLAQSQGKPDARKRAGESSTHTSTGATDPGMGEGEESLQDILSAIRALTNGDEGLPHEDLEAALEKIETFGRLNPFL